MYSTSQMNFKNLFQRRSWRFWTPPKTQESTAKLVRSTSQTLDVRLNLAIPQMPVWLRGKNQDSFCICTFRVSLTEKSWHCTYWVYTVSTLSLLSIALIKDRKRGRNIGYSPKTSSVSVILACTFLHTWPAQTTWPLAPLEIRKALWYYVPLPASLSLWLRQCRLSVRVNMYNCNLGFRFILI